MSQIDLSKLEDTFPGFKMSDMPAKVHFRNREIDVAQLMTYWLGHDDQESRKFQIQCLVIKDPAKPARKFELDISEKEAAMLYMKLTEFLKQTVRRAMKPKEEGES